ncbi:tRNA epoxyqueuosine(34) reductase QueG [Domibacillus sp. PGB-M46]|uniref:tRNA epoxyqueuosine(34) reductase QueG n=1 Tax=Domibacillus sp. PGB-M46 TaxID=2910255 RepID=UPI001F570D51|nr:tRNA epoxyqueuosine(34) reductase QueG [Domibacillus sp. PGB-M46]MCI2253541.1 tRNA epoxyqueuosine(34) reductase QueG [Domibacillus sp. PGB-M46]
MYRQLKQELIDYSKEIGIDKIGFAAADPFLELKQKLVQQQELGYASGFEEKDIEKRTNPALLMDSPRSIIAIALAYPSKLEGAPKGKKGERRGLFCRASWGEDYHLVLRRKLEQLEAFLKEKMPDVQMKSMVDTGELSDRAVAERAGIGWSAKNCAIITPEFGSYVYLGEMLTNIPFEPDTPMESQCGTCTKCIDACPTSALVQGGQLNSQRCIAYLTQTKDFLPEEFRKHLGNRLYGCDTCQTVCPANKGKHTLNHEEMIPALEEVKPLLEPLLSMSNKEFKERFGAMSGSWRGKKPIQRNAVIALAHFREPSSLPALAALLHNDPRPVLRGTAAYTIGQIGGIEAESQLFKALEREEDETVVDEIKKALGQIGSVL